MRLYLYIILSTLLLSACSTNKSFTDRTDQDKAFKDAIKKLNKNPGDNNALEAIPILYKSIQQTHLAKIKNYNSFRENTKWDKIISEYNDLQNAYELVIQSSSAFKLINPENYATQLLESKDAAANEYYTSGLSYLQKEGRDNAKKAYSAFKKSEKFMPGFKDAAAQMNEAYEKAIVDIVINPVQDNSFFFNSGWGNSGYNYSNEFFQQTLVRELSNNTKRYAARFYTDWEARRENIKPDWVIDLRLRNMDIPQPMRNTYQRNASKQIETGRDTSGRIQYRTVYATINITRMSFNARADMEVTIRDAGSGRNISYNTYRDDYRWEQESANYSGDSRALSSYDWNIINNNDSYYNTPRKEDILNELYRKIYPQVFNNITYAVDW
ncbi:MAG: hypothetical protein ABIP80_05545 [Ferruginibacter sp.]